MGVFKWLFNIPAPDANLEIQGKAIPIEELPSSVRCSIAGMAGSTILGADDRGDDIFVDFNGQRLPLSSLPVDVQGQVVEYWEKYVEGDPYVEE